MSNAPTHRDSDRDGCFRYGISAPALKSRSIPGRYPRGGFRAVLLTAIVLVVCVASGTPGFAGPFEDTSPPGPKADDTSTEQVEPPHEFVIVEGQITDHIGAGQKNVTVTARLKADDGGDGELVGETTTSNFGDFKITSPKPVRGDIIVVFSKPLYEDLTRELHVGDDEFPPFIAETLAGRLVVTGRVVEALTGKAIVGASVKLQAAYKDWHQKTDEQGRFRIKGVFPGEGELIVEAKGFGRQRQKVALIEDGPEIRVLLKPERIVHVKLVSDLDEPIVAATVECFDEARDDFRTGVTDANGLVTFHGLHFDAVVLSVRLTHEDHVSTEGFDHKIATPEKEAESTHRLVMPRAGRIAGRITHADTGGPLNGARVMTGAGYSYTSPRDWANYQGRYTVNGVTPGLTTVTVHLSGYAPELETVEVQAGQTAQLDVGLRPGAVLRGIVTNESGEPLSGVFVDTAQWRGKGTLGLRAITGSDGRFVIESAPHDEFEIAVGMARGPHLAKTVKAGSSATVEITLEGVADGAGPGALSWLRVGDAIPAVKLTTLTGETLDVTDMKGKTILLDFWATWCPPCVAELPQLVAVYEKYGVRKNFVMISVSLDGDEKALREVVQEQKMRWHQVFGDAGGAHKAADRYGVSAMPSVFLIGPEGKLVGMDIHGAELVERIEQTLNAKDSP